MNYHPNICDWQIGDIVIHDADAKVEHMLMKVIGVKKAPEGYTIYITEYINKAYHAHNNGFTCEHDKKFLKWNKWERAKFY